jgi:hypothetical protein
MFSVGNIEYSYEEIASFVSDSVVDGYCTECKEVTCNAEPDAEANHCPSCEKNTVQSVLIIMGLI